MRRISRATPWALAVGLGTPWAAAPAASVAPAACVAPVAPAPSADSQPAFRWIYLVRHGHYDRDNDADDRVANGLNAMGRAQAAATGDRFAAFPARPDRIVSSDYTRARETADAVARALGMTAARDTLLRECRPRALRPDLLQGQDERELAACDSALAAAFARYFVPAAGVDARDVLVCHGNVIRWFVARAIGADPRLWGSMEIGNASVTVVSIRPDGGMRLVTFSDMSHVPRDAQTWAGRGPGW